MLNTITNTEKLTSIWMDFCKTESLRENFRFGQYVANNYNVGDLEIYYTKDDSLAFNMIWDWVMEQSND